MLKTYDQLSEDQKEEARKLHPKDFKDWSYQTIGVLIEFSCK